MRARICSVLLLSALAASSLAAAPDLATASTGVDGAVTLSIEDGETSLTGVGFDQRRALELLAEQPGLAGMRAAMRAHATEALGLDLPSGEPGPTDEGADRQVGPMPGEAYALPVGDLDGDGLGDVYSFEDDPDGVGVTVVARRGVDGSALWTRSDGSSVDLIPLPLGDLDGDGAVDLLIWGLEYEGDGLLETCSDTTCEGSVDAVLTWSIGVASGADGTDVWSDRISGEVHARYRSAYDGVDPVLRDSTEEYEVTGENVFVLPQLSGDHDGDGVADLLVDVVREVEYRSERSYRDVADVAREREESFELDVDNDVEIRALDGSAIAELGTGRTDLTLVAPLRNATADLLVVTEEADTGRWQCRRVEVVGEVGPCTAPEDLPTTVSVLDGRTLEPRWSVELPPLSNAIVEPFDDLDHDGHVELVVLDLFDDHTEMLDGASGDVVWSGEPVEGDVYAFAFPTGDLTGDGIRDLLSFVERYDEDGRETIVLERIDGRDGATVASSTHEIPEVPAEEYRFTSLSLEVGPELDRRPGRDLLLEVDVQTEQGSAGSIVGESGRDGTRVVELDGAAWDLWGEARLTDGDTDDLMLMTPLPRFVICEDEECAFPPLETTIHGITLDGTPLWSHEVDLDRGYLYAVGDRDGRGGTELLVETYRESPEGGFDAGYAIVDGADLGVRWGRGARPPGL